MGDARDTQGGSTGPRNPASDAKPLFVLVHGAWHGAWCWERVADRLTRAGHRVLAPTLRGLGERRLEYQRDITLADHVDDVVDAVAAEDPRSIVLCGHSYGGMVITGAVERLRHLTSALIYLDAFIPRAGQSLNDMAGPERTADRTRQAEVAGDGRLPPPPASFFRVNPKDRAWVDATCTDQPFRTFGGALHGVEAHETVARKLYVRARDMPAAILDEIADARRTRPGWQVIDLPFGHDLMIDAPAEVTAILTGATQNRQPAQTT